MATRNKPRSPEEFEAEQQMLLERWPDGNPQCPKCRCAKVYDCRRKDGHPRWKCSDCRKEFSLTSGTPWQFHKKSHSEMCLPQINPKAMFYPFMPKRSTSEGAALVLAINAVVPRSLPSEIRSDVCQELAAGVLAGHIQLNTLRQHVEQAIRCVKDASGFIEYALSLDAPAPGIGTDSFQSGATSFYEAAFASELQIQPDEAIWAGEEEDEIPDLALWALAA